LTSSQIELFSGDEPDIALLSSVLEQAERIYLKRLALNDWQWAENRNAHQAGIYVPVEDRDDTRFFPRLKEKKREEGASILEAFLDITWVELDKARSARLVNYRSKGQETHLTRLPKECFEGLNPASFLLIAKTGEKFLAMVLDSASTAVEYLRSILGFESSFRSGFFEPKKALRAKRVETVDFVEEALAAFNRGRLRAFANAHATLPTTHEMAAKAQAAYLESSSISNLDPFSIPRPGDVLMTISRDIEYSIFKELQLRARSLELVTIILGAAPSRASVESALRTVINDYQKIDKVLLSAAQQRKSRAGYSFEHHIARMLRDGQIPHQEQVVIKSRNRKRPDFVLPGFKLYADSGRKHQEALVLSAKTTLRERWKQVSSEIRDCDLYLATVDDGIADNAIEDMASRGIILLVPESLKQSKTTVYEKRGNVISFAQFFQEDVRKKRWPLWLRRGLVQPFAMG
jgi:hypothetical protein